MSAHLPAHHRCILRRHTGPTAAEKAEGVGVIVGGFSDSLTDPWSQPQWAPMAYDRPWVGTRGNLRLDGDPTMVGGFASDAGPLASPWETEQWEPQAYDQPSRISRALGSMRDGNPAMLGALNPDVLNNFRGPKTDPWSLAGKFAPRRYERPWIRQGLGVRADADPTMIGAMPSQQRQARAVLRAAKGLGRWAEKNRIPVGRAFIGSGDANAAGWTLHLPSENDRIQAIQKAKALSILHRTFQNIKGSDMGSGWFLVYFTDDPAAELAIAPDDAADASSAGLEDEEVGFLKKIFGPKPKVIRRKIARMEKRLAKLREKLSDMGEDDEDDFDDDDLEGLEVGRMRGGFGRRGRGRMGFGRQGGFAAQGGGGRGFGFGPQGGFGRTGRGGRAFYQTASGEQHFRGRGGRWHTTPPWERNQVPSQPQLRTLTRTLPGNSRITQPFMMAGGDPVMLTQGVHPFR